jgi:hypothetical protein
VITQTRFVVDREAYQAPSPTLNAVPVVTLQRYLSEPRLAWDFLTLHEPEPWDEFFGLAELPRAIGADFEVGGRRYGLYGHEFRRVPVDALMDVWTERALAQDVTLRPAARDDVLLLSQTAFTDAVRRALRDLHRPELLARNPLVRTRSLANTPAPTGRTRKRSGVCCGRRSRRCVRIRVTTSCCGPWSAPTCTLRPPRRPPPKCSGCRSAPIGVTSPRAWAASSPRCGITRSTARHLSSAEQHRARSGLDSEHPAVRRCPS